jgi:hypothetical protein
MRYRLFIGILVAGLSGIIAFGQASPSVLGSVRLTHAVIADNGRPLAAGLYQIRLTDDEPKPAIGKSPNARRWIEFVRGGRVVVREVATIVSAKEIGTITKRPPLLANESRLDALEDGNYVRISINWKGTNYIINMPPAATPPLPPKPPTGLTIR